MATPISNSTQVTFISKPVNNDIAALVNNSKWGGGIGAGVNLTYSIPSGTASFINPYSSDDEPGFNSLFLGWYALNSTQQQAFQSALTTYSNVANINFIQVADNSSTVGEIRIAFSDAVLLDGSAAAWGYFPSNHPSGGDIWLNPEDSSKSFINGSYEYLTLIHETGHALGLRHPFAGGSSWNTTLPEEFDNIFFTVMSYTDDPSGNEYFIDRYPETPMVLDIQAIQYLYGPNTSYNSGDNNYIYNSSGKYFETIWDAGGIDTIDYTSSSVAAIIDLREGEWSSLGQPIVFTNIFGATQYTDPRTVWIAYGAEIENAKGGHGDDLIIGNELDNNLFGNAGIDLMYGGGGGDSIYGESGDDVIFGDEGDDFLEGGPGNDYLEGGGGNDIFDWSADSRLGDDTFVGGPGDDVYVISGSDTIIEASGEGTDRIWVSIDFSIASIANVEELFLFGPNPISATGNSLDNKIIGNESDNVLSGEGGNDELSGDAGNDTLVYDPSDTINVSGGVGTDKLRIDGNSITLNIKGKAGSIYKDIEIIDVTGTGNNTLILDSSSVLDISSETNSLRVDGDSGDSVIADGTWVLGISLDINGQNYIEYSNGEALIVLQSGISFSPTELGPIIGGSSDDTLNGGITDDELLGGGGDDELGGNDGDDLLKGGGGSDALNGDGGEDKLNGGGGDDSLNGGDGNDILLGGKGKDVLDGGEGSDTYIVHKKEDSADSYHDTGTGINDIDIIDASKVTTLLLTGDFFNSGIEEIHGSINGTLLTGNVQVLVWDLSDVTLQNISKILGSKSDDIINGSPDDDKVIGAGGDDTLNGDNGDDNLKGGGGSDTLNGGSGDDNLNGGGGNDTINGGDGNDILLGGKGTDILDGGEGSDIYTVHKKEDSTDSYHDSGTGISDVDILDASKAPLLLLTGDFVNSGLEIIRGATLGTVIGANVSTLVWDFSDSTLLNIKFINGSLTTDQITGSLSNDKIKGNDGDDLINGDEGNDKLIGGAGNDTLSGDEGDDVVKGSAGDDELSGGDGNDKLIGGGDEDTFIFNTALGASNVDTLVKFNSADDMIALDDDIFTALSTAAGNTLSGTEFVANSIGEAEDSEDRIIYNTDTGELFYDADGDGSETAIMFAILDGAPEIDADDFIVIA